MGIKASDFDTVSALTPPGRSVYTKFFRVARTGTVAAVKAQLPANASVIGARVLGSVASNAGTSATVTVTVKDNAATLATGAYDVKTNGAATGFVQFTGLPNVEKIPQAGDLKIEAVYAETGTASATGGPWVIAVEYVA